MVRRSLIFMSGLIFALALSSAHAAPANDPVLETWKLNVARSKFTPGPG